jgi:transcription elongation factor Elf1
VGFYCPTCGHEEANLLGIDIDEGGFVVGLRLLCARCESVFSENTVTDEPQPIDDLIKRGR